MTEKQIIMNEEAKREYYSILAETLLQQTNATTDLDKIKLPF